MNFEELQAFLGRNQLLAMALLGITLAILYTELSRLFRGFRGLRPAELTVLMNRESALVVDLQAQADFDRGHIAGAKNVQVSQFDPENRKLAGAKALPVVAVCRTGQASAAAAKRLRKAGFEKVYVLEGGLAAWQQADLPLVKGKG